MIPINDLRRMDKQLSDNIKRVVNNCFDKGWYLLGPETTAFENEFAQYCDVEHCVGVANGTDALELALRALDINVGDQVATVANAGMYSTIAIRNLGAEPLYIDVNTEDLNMDPNCLKNQLTSRTKAIIVTHLYGKLAAMDEILGIANSAQVPLIEDCAQAHGAMLKGKRAGSFGTMGCFSFYPTKNLGALGDAGAIITDNSYLAEKIFKLRQYGWEKKYHAILKGGKNSRIDEMQAAILRIKLPFLDEWNKKRRDIAKLYFSQLKNYDLILPNCLDEQYVGHLYVVRAKKRNELKEHLSSCKISTDIHYPIPDYLQPSISNHDRYCLPNTETACNEVLTLPCFPYLTEEETIKIIKGIHSFFV